jgi:hypothetical protein
MMKQDLNAKDAKEKRAKGTKRLSSATFAKNLCALCV